MFQNWLPMLRQGLKGHHPLFEPNIIRFALSNPITSNQGLNRDLERQCEFLIDELEKIDDVVIQREQISLAPLPVQEVFVQLYFTLLDRYMEPKHPIVH
jgi:hypothetical protein